MIRKLSIALSILLVLSCNKVDHGNESSDQTEPKFVVDKILDSEDRVLAEYKYLDNFNLHKRICYSVKGNIISELIFQYEDNQISAIEHIDNQFPENSYTLKFKLDSKGNIIEDYKYNFGVLIEHRKFKYGSNNKIESISNSEGLEYLKFSYLETGNVLKTSLLLPDYSRLTQGRNLRNEIGMYEYDDKRKPNFGLGKVFQINPYPNSDEENIIEQNLSTNNIKKVVHSISYWEYTYNEFGFPLTIEQKFQGFDDIETQTLKLVYKEIGL